MKKLTVMALFFASLAFSQVNTSRIDGAVTDPTGAAVPGAEVTVTNVSNGAVFKTITGDRGEWALPSMQAASYRVSVTKSGFKAGVVPAVEINAGVPASVNVKLELGQATETVEVVGGAEIVQATSATVSSTVTGRQINELPFATRNAVELMVTQPGTQTPTNPRSSTINGLPKGAINITIDGMNSQDNMLKSSDGFFSYIMPSVDSLEEVTLTTSAAGVDSTSQGGAQIKFVTRGGTNEYHGGAFYQLRNTALDANYYFNNINSQPRDIVHLRQYGGRVGGPIKKDKLFFFGDVELYRYPGTNTYNRTILNDKARSGIYQYKDASGAIQEKNLYTLVGSATVPAGAKYPTTPDPILGKTFSDIAGLSGGGVLRQNGPVTNDYNTQQLTYQPSGLDSRDFYAFRVDYNINVKHHLSLVYDFDKYVSVPDFLNNIVRVYPGTGTVLGSTVDTGQRSNRFAGTLSLRSALSARVTNEVRGGLNGGTVLFFDAIAPGLFSTWRGFNPSLGSGLSGVTTNAGPQRRNAPVKDFGDTLSIVKGAHQISVGGNFSQVNVFQQIQGSAMFPSIAFGIASNDPINTGATNLFTAANFPGASASQLSAAAGLYATLTGRVSSITRGVALDETSHQYGATAPIDRDHIREFGVFAQDTWRVLPALTVTLGLRYEKQFAFQNLNGTYSQVGLAGIWGLSGIGNLFQPGTLTGTAPTYTPANGSNTYRIPAVWAPSAGIAWQLPAMEGPLGWIFGKHQGASVLRAGYALASVREGMNVYTGTYGANQGLTLDASLSPSTFPADFGAPGSVLFRDTNLPVRSGLPATPQYPIIPTFTNALYDFDPKLKMGYVQSWNIGWQRELGRNNVVEVRYNGNHGVDLWRRYSLNETNIIENGFLSEFQIAQSNLAIARGGNINNNTSVTNFGNQGLPGQKALTILPIALGTACCNDTTTASNLQLGQAGTLAQATATNATRMAALTNAKYPANFFKVNPTVGGGSANLVTNNGSSFYDSLQVEFRRRLSKGLLVQGSYAWAKAIANGATASSTDVSQPTTLRNLALDRLPESFDIRHGLKFNWIYELPFGGGRPMMSNLSNPLARKAVEGWEIAGVVRLQSGTPSFWGSFATFNQNGNGVVLHNITSKQLQDMIGTYKITGSDGKGLVYYLPPPTPGAAVGDNLITNTMAAFQQGSNTPAQVDQTKPYIGPAAAGQMGWNGYFYLPWQRHFDMSVVKKTKITEKVNVEFRAQALNVFNLTNFLASANIGTSLGQVTSAYRDISGTVDPGGRILEFVLRVNF